MPDPQKTVFISYRRSVASFIARAIFGDLRLHHYDVFMDVENIDSGQFDQIILNQIEARAHFLIILTPGTLERCAEPGDWLRREIEYAVEKGRNIVPLFVNDFKMDDAAKKLLTGNLATLANLNGLTVPHEYFDEAMERLRKRYLKQPVVGALKPAPPGDRLIVQEKIEAVAAQPPPTTKQLSAEEYYNRALQKQDFGDINGAISDYNEAIRLNPQFAEAYNNRGNARQVQNDFDGAITDYDEALRLSPEKARIHCNRAHAYYYKGDFYRAITDYDETISVDPQGAYAYNDRAETYFAIGKFNNALTDFLKANELKRAFNMTLGGLAITQFALGQKDEATHLWHSLIAKDRRYRDADWVGKEFRWRPELVEAARKLIAEL